MATTPTATATTTKATAQAERQDLEQQLGRMSENFSKLVVAEDEARAAAKAERKRADGLAERLAELENSAPAPAPAPTPDNGALQAELDASRADADMQRQLTAKLRGEVSLLTDRLASLTAEAAAASAAVNPGETAALRAQVRRLDCLLYTSPSPRDRG